MDPAIHPGALPVADGYRRFAEREACGASALYATWAQAIATDAAVLSAVESLPPAKRQPNLVFAAARWHGAGTSYASFRATVLGRWPQVRHTVLTRATQTNEAGRCAVLLPFLAGFPQPLALIEVGASAGLCLLPDRYSYRYDDGTALDPGDGVFKVVIPCRLGPGVPAPRMPRIVWRAGIDVARGRQLVHGCHTGHTRQKILHEVGGRKKVVDRSCAGGRDRSPGDWERCPFRADGLRADT